jgi:mRNA interferase MazF
VIYARFSVIRVPFPFTDQQSQKRRPAVVLSTPEFQRSSGHLLLAMVTSAAQSAWPLDWPIQDLAGAGLKHPCIIRAKLFTLDERLGQGELGQLSPTDQQGLCRQLAALLADLKPA